MEQIRSVGPGVLVSGLRTLKKQGGNLKLCDVYKNIHEIFDPTQISNNIAIYPTPEEAVKSYSWS